MSEWSRAARTTEEATWILLLIGREGEAAARSWDRFDTRFRKHVLFVCLFPLTRSSLNAQIKNEKKQLK